MSATLGHELRNEKNESAKDEKMGSLEDSKQVETISINSIDSRDVDEALELVGMRRTVEFSEEYNKKLRRKLVCQMIIVTKNKFKKCDRTGSFLRFVQQCTSLSFCESRSADYLISGNGVTMGCRDKNTLSYAR